MAATTKRKPKPAKPAFYVGAETCDFAPDWRHHDATVLDLCRHAHAADPDDLAPSLILADRLAEIGDSRQTWVRVACDLWAACRKLKPGDGDWQHAAAKAALQPACETIPGWRLSCLWGCLVAWHTPAGDQSGPMGRTWADARVGSTWRGVWWWSLGFLATAEPDLPAGRQAYAAWSQAYAAWRQADAAGRQADAAGSQAYAAGSQADAAWSQAYAAGSQAYAAGSQAWRFARSVWKLCVERLPELISVG